MTETKTKYADLSLTEVVKTIRQALADGNAGDHDPEALGYEFASRVTKPALNVALGLWSWRALVRAQQRGDVAATVAWGTWIVTTKIVGTRVRLIKAIQQQHTDEVLLNLASMSGKGTR